jgi:hypothetical protein
VGDWWTALRTPGANGTVFTVSFTGRGPDPGPRGHAGGRRMWHDLIYHDEGVRTLLRAPLGLAI